MERVFVLTSENHSEFAVNDDRGLGGKSVSALGYDGKSHILQCQLEATYQWPFCEMTIRFAEEPNGMDLTDYESVSFDLGYQGPGPRAVRFYLRNFEPELSKIGDRDSLKVNEIEFELPSNGVINVPLKLMRIASWWVAEKKVPLVHTDMRIDNVSFVELSTNSAAKQGNYRIEVRQIAFHGKWVSLTRLLSLLMTAWLLYAALYLVIEIRAYRLRLQASTERLKQLQSINRSLHLEAKELAGQAHTDPLTGVLNRGGLRDYMLGHWKGDLPDQSGVSLIFADIDHFKNINDTYGHQIGDEVLRAFANLIQQHIRHTDRLVRWGGEEFLIVCGQTQLEQAVRLAEKLRVKLTQAQWPAGIEVTCSFGVATQQGAETFGTVVNRADKGLYLAKTKGRNRVDSVH